MKTTLSSHDWQALSDYLDGQLSPQARARLEARLKANAGLRLALEELRRTRIILKNAPRLRARRNFTLTAAMVARRSPQRSFWQPFSTLRLSSAVAALLFILVFLGDYLSGGYQGAPVALAPYSAGQRQALEAASTNESLTDQDNQFAAPSEAPGPAEQPFAKALQGPLTTDTPAAMPTLSASLSYPVPPALAAKIAPSTTVTESLSAVLLPTMTPEATQPDETTLLEAYPPAEATPAALGADAQTEPTQPAAATAPFWTFWRVIEAGLALLAVVTGLAAFLLRRSANP
jgi:hypothetical protein